MTSKANLVVTKAATIQRPPRSTSSPAADDWNGFGHGDATPTVTAVRVDQSSVRIDFKSTDAAQDGNTTVTLTVNGDMAAAPAGASDITFGGKKSTTVSTVLDANGVGSVTITPDAGTIQDGDTLKISGSFAQTLEFQRAAVKDVYPVAATYFSADNGTVDVSAEVLDQFGLPVAAGFIEAKRNGTPEHRHHRAAQGGRDRRHGDLHVHRRQRGQRRHGRLVLQLLPGQHVRAPDANNNVSDPAQIKYSATGMGSDFNTTLDTQNTGAPGYKASDVSVIPLADANANVANGLALQGDESVDLAVTGLESSVPVTVSVDNGARILKNSIKLSDGKSSIETTTTAGGLLPAGYTIIGTKSGVVTVTVTSAKRDRDGAVHRPGWADALATSR